MHRFPFSAGVCISFFSAALLAAGGCSPGAPPGGGASGAITPEERAAIEKEIRDLEEKFNGSYGRNDMAAYWPFYADELTQWWDTGRVSLEQYKKDWNGMLQAGGAILEARMDDVQVHVSPAGDAAVASYKIFVRMRDAAGKETAAWYHESDTWFRREDGWKIVHLHYSAVPQQPAAGAAPTAGGAGSAAGGAGQT